MTNQFGGGANSLLERRFLLFKKEDEKMKEWKLIYKGNLEKEASSITINKMPDGSTFSFDEIIYKIKPVVNITGTLLTYGIMNSRITTSETSADTARLFFGHVITNPLGCEGFFTCQNGNSSLKSDSPYYINNYTLLNDGALTYISFNSSSATTIFSTTTELEIYGR